MYLSLCDSVYSNPTMFFCVLCCTLNPVVLFILLYCTMWLCVLCSTLYPVVLCTLLYYTSWFCVLYWTAPCGSVYMLYTTPCGSVNTFVLHHVVLCTLLYCTMWFCVLYCILHSCKIDANVVKSRKLLFSVSMLFLPWAYRLKCQSKATRPIYC